MFIIFKFCGQSIIKVFKMRIMKIKALSVILIFMVLLMDISAIGLMSTIEGKVLDTLSRVKEPKIYINSLNPSFQGFKNGTPAKIWEEEIIGRITVSSIANTPDVGQGIKLSLNIEGNWTMGINATGYLSEDIEEIYEKSVGNINRTGTLVLAFLATDIEVLNETLFSDERTRIVTDEILRFAEEVGDAAIIMTGNYCSAMNLMHSLWLAEGDRRVSEVYLIILTHGVLNETSQIHGMLMHGENDVVVVNGETLKYLAKILRLKRLDKLKFVYLPFCNMGKEKEIYGDSSVVAFFEEFSKAQILTYEGETYLNGEYIASIQSVLSSGTYELVEENVYLPIQVIDNITGQTTEGYLEFRVIDEVQETNSTVNPYEIYDNNENITLGSRLRRRTISKRNYRVTVHGKRVKATIHHGTPPRSYVRKKLKHLSYGVPSKCKTFGKTNRALKIDFKHKTRSIPFVTGRFWKPPKTQKKYYGNGYVGEFRANIDEIRRAILIVDEIFNTIYKNYYQIKSAIYRWIDATFNAPWNKWMRGPIKTTLDNTVFRGANFLINFAKQYLKTIICIAYNLKKSGKNLGELVAALIIAAIAKFAKGILKYFSWTIDKLLKALSKVLSVDLKWVEKILTGWINPALKFLDDAVAYSEELLKISIKNFMEAFTKVLEPFIHPLKTIADILREWFGTWMKQIAWAFTAKIYANMIVEGEKEKAEGFEPRHAYYYQRFDEFDLIKSLSPLYVGMNWKDKFGNTLYIAKSSYAMPIIAKIYLKLAGKNSVSNVLYTTETLVKLENGEVIWVNCKNIGLEKDGDRLKVYTTVEENGKFVRREIVKDLGVTRRVMLTYYMDGEEMKAIPIIYIARENIPLDGDEKVKVAEAIKTVRNLGECFKIVENDFGEGEIIAIKDISKVMKNLSPENYRRKTLYCVAQLLDMETNIKGIREKLPEILSYDERFRPALDAFAKNLGNAIGERSPRSGIVVNALNMEFDINDEFMVYSMVDPYYAGKDACIYVDPTIVSRILSGDERGMRILKLAGYPKIVEENGKWKVKPTNIREGEISKYYDLWKKNLRYGNFEAATLNLFRQIVSVAELFSLVYGVDKEMKIYLGEFKGETVEVTLGELMELRDRISEESGKGRSWTKRFMDSLSDRELKIICRVTGTDLDLNLKNAKPELMVDLGLKVILAVCPPEQRYSMVVHQKNIICRNLSDLHKAALKSDIEESPLVGKKGSKAAWLASKMIYTLPLAEEIIRELEEKIKELESKLLEIQDPKITKRIEEEIEDLKCLRKELEAVRSHAEDYLGKVSVEAVKRFASESGRMVVHGYLMFNGAQFMLLGGMTLALTLIRRCTGFFAWLEENRWAKILLGASMTAIFIVGLNIDSDWINKVCGKFKVGVKDLVESIAREASGGSNLLEKSCFVLGMFIGGFGMVMRTLGIQFYTSDEICEKIGEYLNMVARGAGDVWNMVMGFKIPFVEQTVFDVLLGLALGGPVEVIGDALMGVVINRFVAPMLNQAIINVIANLIANYI